MPHRAATTHVIPRSYLSGLFLRCGLFFACGLLLTGIILYFSAHQPLGPSYEESFVRLAQLKREMLIKSIIIYTLLLALIVAGVIFTATIYSHRVVGPLVGIKRVIQAVAGGDLNQAARLRPDDAIKPMAHALNTMIESYRTKMTLMDQQAKALQEILEQPGEPLPAAELVARARAIKETLGPLQLR